MNKIDTQSPVVGSATPSTRMLFLFILIGGTAAFGYAIICTIFSLLFGLRPAVSSVLGYGIALPPAYGAQKLITFRSEAAHKIAFPKYLSVQVISNINAAILSEILTEKLGYPALPSFVIIAGIVGITNFWALRYWAFRPPKNDG